MLAEETTRLRGCTPARQDGNTTREGCMKQLFNKRLKQMGVRWRVEHVEPVV